MTIKGEVVGEDGTVLGYTIEQCVQDEIMRQHGLNVEREVVRALEFELESALLKKED